MKLFKVVTQAAIFYNNELLLLLRPKNSFVGGMWETPGGEVLDGETLEEACKREVCEEAGIDIRVQFPFHCFEYDDSQGNRTLCMHYLVCLDEMSIISLSEEHVDYCWITEKEIDSMEITQEMKKSIHTAFAFYKLQIHES